MLSREELIQRGLDAEALLASPAYAQALNDLADFHLAAITSSPPAARDTREWHYTMTQALRELHDQLQSYATVKQEIEAQADLETEEDFD